MSHGGQFPSVLKVGSQKIGVGKRKQIKPAALGFNDLRCIATGVFSLFISDF
jgi:hypothetical protein